MAMASTAVSLQRARRFLRLAAEAESRSHFPLARQHFLTAIRHDPTPEAGLAFGGFLSEIGQTHDAILVLLDSWQLAKRRERWPEVAACCRALAMQFHRAGQASQANRFVQRAAAAEMSSWSDQQATLSSEQLLIESQFAEWDGDIDRAFALCQAALEAAFGTLRSDVLRHRARLHTIHQRRLAAAHDLLDAARLAREFAGDRAYGQCLLELGHALQSLSRAQLAIRSYRAAALRFERAGRTKQAGAARRWLMQSAAIKRTAGGDPDWN
jgi:hypothetical protein